MKDIRVDSEGELRCWNCGNKGLLEKRTFRSKMLVGVGALLTKKKLKCQTCGEYNDTGNAKPYEGPASRKWRKAWEKSESAKTASQREDEARRAETNAHAIADALVAAADGLRTASDKQPAEIESVPVGAIAPAQSTAPPPPPAWLPDPTGRHEVRYWDGTAWTEHVSDNGVQANDPAL